MSTAAHSHHAEHVCCDHTEHDGHHHPTPTAHAHHAHAGGWRGAASVTLHCLIGCAIGELTGLAIGVSLGWVPNHTVTLAVALSFVSGFALTLIPMVQRGFGFAASLRT